jgi:hypothetical protein
MLRVRFATDRAEFRALVRGGDRNSSPGLNHDDSQHRVWLHLHRTCGVGLRPPEVLAVYGSLTTSNHADCIVQMLRKSLWRRVLRQAIAVLQTTGDVVDGTNRWQR